MATPMDAGDARFLQEFEDGVLEKSAFKHRDHVRLAWVLLSVCDADEASERVGRGIRAFAARHGASGLFHVTVTEAWMRVVAGAMAADAATPTTRAAANFDEWIAGHPDLLDASLLARYFSDDVLKSPAAKQAWIEPDRMPLPPV